MKLRWTLFLLLGLFLGTILAGKKPPRSKNKKPAFADCLTKCVKSLEGSLDHTKLFECSSQCEEQAGLKSKESPATLKEAMPSASSDTPPPVIKATSKPVVRTADETSESPPSLAKNEVPVAVKTAAPSTPAMEPILPVFAMQTGDAPAITPGADKNDGNELKLLLGAGANVDAAAMKGWVTVDVRDGLGVDHVMDARNLSLFNDESVSVIYAAHLLQTFHYRYNDEIMAVLKEWNRVLVPGGEVYISVPDMPTLCWLYLNPNLGVNARFRVLQIMLGTQEHVHDSHHAGFDINFLEHYLSLSGFSEYERVPAFSFFDDTSNQKILDTFISLNVIARKADESRQSSRRSQRI